MEGPIHVVTCFLRRGTQVLILKRSQGVKTNKGKWAGVSGYVEVDETPIQTAYKELEEEVTAKPDQIELVRQAEPLTFLDRVHDTTWVVHPFLFDDLGVDFRVDFFVDALTRFGDSTADSTVAVADAFVVIGPLLDLR